MRFTHPHDMPSDDLLRQMLLDNIKNRKSELETLFARCSDHWRYEDPVYRFYHQSFKVYGLQAQTEKIVQTLASLLPDRKLNSWFLQIVSDGTGKQFEMEHNNDWMSHTRPILEAFFHARYMLEMAVRYSSLEKEAEFLPSGWAALLYLFDLR